MERVCVVTAIVAITLFADGVVGFATNDQELQRFLDVCTEWANEFGFYEQLKCAALRGTHNRTTLCLQEN